MVRQCVLVGVFIIAVAGSLLAQPFEWTTLEGPEWAKGIDVAYGVGGLDEDWHRYLVGNNTLSDKVFGWPASEQRWFYSSPLPNANKIVSYTSGNGNYAVCSAYEDDIYFTDDGGSEWNSLSFPGNFNTHFSTVEVALLENTPGDTIIVGCLHQQNLASAYYTDDGGDSWAKFGDDDDPLDDIDVYDIEDCEVTGFSAGTENG